MRNSKTGAAVLATILAVALGLGCLAYFGVGRRHTMGYQNINLGLDLRGGVSIVYEAEKDAPTTEEMNSVVGLIQQRLDRKGWTEAEISRQGTKRVRVDIPGVEDAETAVDELGRTAHLTFRDEEGNILVDGIEVTSATKGSQNAQSVVSLEFSSLGKTQFEDATRNNVGRTLRIFLDEELISAPNVNETIVGGSAYISGSFTPETAEELAALIRSGSLPFNLSIIQSSNVGAKLGANSLNTSLLAGLIGICLVLVFMLIVYRVAGVVADIALIIYTVLMIVLLSALKITLSLPGIAGIILSIGMAVDANVIIFERLKEELSLGRSMRSSVDNAFKRAFSAILDGNVTTLISAAVLFMLGSGPVKGFAQTLALGIVISMFTAIVITRMLLKCAVSFGFVKPSLFRMGLKVNADNANRETNNLHVYQILQNRVKFFIFSGCVIVLGWVVMTVNGIGGNGVFNFDVEFTGGTSIVLDLQQDFNTSDVSNIITEVTGQTSPQVQRVTGSDSVSIKIKSIDQTMYQELIAKLTETYPILLVESSDDVSATVSGEMQRTAIIAVLIACVAMLIYITLRFRDFALGGAAILAILHDALIMLTAYAVLRIPVNYSFIAAILTVLGYSINANIVEFDRMRENKRLLPSMDAMSLMNLSIRQSLTRSLYTTFTTLFTIVMVAILGVPSVREFSIPIIIGLIFGTYSSIFLAGSLWYMLSSKKKKA